MIIEITDEHVVRELIDMAKEYGKTPDEMAEMILRRELLGVKAGE